MEFFLPLRVNFSITTSAIVPSQWPFLDASVPSLAKALILGILGIHTPAAVYLELLSQARPRASCPFPPVLSHSSLSATPFPVKPFVLLAPLLGGTEPMAFVYTRQKPPNHTPSLAWFLSSRCSHL